MIIKRRLERRYRRYFDRHWALTSVLIRSKHDGLGRCEATRDWKMTQVNLSGAVPRGRHEENPPALCRHPGVATRSLSAPRTVEDIHPVISRLHLGLQP